MKPKKKNLKNFEKLNYDSIMFKFDERKNVNKNKKDF